MDFEVRKSFLPYALPMFDDREIGEVQDTIRSNWVSKGPKTIEFEKKFADYVGAKHAIATNSCTAALHTALAAKGIGHGDEVITTPLTFTATANVVIHTGAKPVFVDVDPFTYNIDPDSIEEKINEKTKAIIPVHFSGQACDMDKILELARRYNIFVLEDGAHAIYTKYRDKTVGSIGDATAFSFYATKNLSTGEGGMLTTDNEKLAEQARIISLHGMSKNAWSRYSKKGNWYYEVLYPGFKYNMTDIQASLGLHQLEKLEEMQRIREQYANIYNSSFESIKEIIIPGVVSGSRHAWHLYVIRVNEEMLDINRDEFIEELTGLNIGTSVHFIPVHLHPYYKEKFNYGKGDFPIAESIYESIISLPLYPAMTRQDIDYVVEGVKLTVKKHRK